MIETLSLMGLPIPEPTVAPSNPMGAAPLRRPGSVRRTATIDATWPDGRGGPTRHEGRARDIFTPEEGGAPIILTEDLIVATADRRELLHVVSVPSRPGLPGLAGARAGGHLRTVLDEHFREERVSGTPFYLLLDDLAGATLVSEWAWCHWESPEHRQSELAKKIGGMEGVCIGFRPGSHALGDATGARPPQNMTRVVPLPHPDDPDGWHSLPDAQGTHFRRARRIDVWREDGEVCIDAAFQDSASTPQMGRMAIHEYTLSARADAKAHRLVSLSATPRTLPYAECPAAIVNVSSLVGMPLADLRIQVLDRLRKTAGCTHLNDMLRSLADVTRLVADLDRHATD